MSAYQRLDGLDEGCAGDLMSFGVAAGTSVDLQISFRNSETGDPMGPLPLFYLSAFDIDGAPIMSGVLGGGQRIDVSPVSGKPQYSAFHVSYPTNIVAADVNGQPTDDSPTSFSSCVKNGAPGDPSNCAFPEAICPGPVCFTDVEDPTEPYGVDRDQARAESEHAH